MLAIDIRAPASWSRRSRVPWPVTVMGAIINIGS